MSLRWWQHALTRSKHDPRDRRGQGRRSRWPRRPLVVEVLEDRILLSTVTWTNPAGGDWDTAGNWSTGVVPGAGDDVVINALNAGASVTHAQNTTDAAQSVTASAPMTLSKGTLSVAGNFNDSSAVSLAGGTLAKANVQTGTTLQGAGGALDGVTLGAGSTLTMPANQSVAVTNGLMVNGTVNFTGSFTWLRFSGATPTLGGTGTVESTYTGGNTGPGLLTETNNATLTLLNGLHIHGGVMYIGPDTGGGIATGSVVNQATITAAGAGTLYLGGVAMTSVGTIQAVAGGSLVVFNSVTINQPGILAGRAGTTIAIGGNVVGSTRNADQYAPQGAVTLSGAGTAQVNGAVVNGSVSPVPDGGPVAFSALTPGAIATAGQVDDWTFFGWAGHAVEVLVGTGGGSLFAPSAPTLNFAQVQLVDQGGSVVATASNSASGTDAILQAVTLSADGTYHLHVQAGPGHAANTGGYVLTLWDATVHTAAVNLNQTTISQLASAFTMDQGGQFHFAANLVAPSTMSYHIASTLYLQYSNTGDLAMPAPIIDVTVFQKHANGTTDQKALLTLDSSIAKQGLWTPTVPAGFSNTIKVLATGATPGLLQPGESIQVPICYAGWQQPWDIPGYPDFQPDVAVEDTTDTTPIPWSTLQAQFRPPQISTTAWNALFPNLQAQVGNTWGAFVQRLDNDASYLGHLGEKVTDIGQLWQFEIQQANGFSPVQTLSAAVDASVPTPGPALTVDRALPNSIAARNQKGPFGFGWQWPAGWQRVLSVAADGTVTISNPDGDADGAPRVFEPDSRGGYFAEPGDEGTLRSVSGGFLLQEADGDITTFGSNGAINYVQDTHGNKVNASYTNGSLTSLSATTGQGLTFTYNGAGLITSVADSTGRTTTYAYDASNNYLLSVTDLAGRITSYIYDTSGVPATANALLSVRNPDGTVDHFTYDSQGRLSQHYIDDGSSGGTASRRVTYAYGPAGEVAATDAVGDTTKYFADARGLFVKVEDPPGECDPLDLRR